MSPAAVRVIAVTGGKGGVGKTNVSVNLSLSLAAMGQRVVLMDADLGLANVDVMLGIRPQRNIADMLAGDCTLRQVLVPVKPGLQIVPASSGTQEMTQLSPHQHAELVHAFADIQDELDVLVVDTAAGISESVLSFVRAAQEVLVVVCDEPTSITDAYALIKLLNRDSRISRFRVLANMVRSDQEGRNMYNKLVTVTDRFLDVALQYVGSIPYDESVRKAVQMQRAVFEKFPNSKASQAYRQLANKVTSWPVQATPRGHLEFFVERLVRGAGRKD
ncbi:MinD/ParA family protein [Marinobacterium sp. CAU 1594]|nr:MinD/ParA family protein [Marinobacterium arenosum]MBY4675961.1 MinD/ParA family protein [Marinobacterium arenosum]